MWIILGILALLFLILGFLINDKKALIFIFLSLSFTILTIGFLYSMETSRLLEKDISGMLDLMPTMTKIIWIGSFLSIILNGISLYKNTK